MGRFTVRAGRAALVRFDVVPVTPAASSAGSIREAALADTAAWWRSWSGQCAAWGAWSEAVAGSLRVLKALTYGPTGGMVAAPTTSLPEWPGGVRNWDYRYCWLRDASLTLYALMLAGYASEAEAWREWLLARSQVLLPHCRRSTAWRRERDFPSTRPLAWGIRGSRPVRIGNDAHRQLQLDVYGEVLDALYGARRLGIGPDRWAWSLEQSLLDTLEGRWREPDEGIWEIRGPRQQLTHSKVMAWVAFDRAIKSVEGFGLDGPVDRWRKIQAAIHTEVCARGYDGERNTFTQVFGRPELDASLLMIPRVGFLPPTDRRVTETVEAIERELMIEGFVRRYQTNPQVSVDGLPPGEGVFLPCSFWLADAYAQMGRYDDAQRLFERLLALRNDVGLLPEEYDPHARRFLGNFPQAFSHVALVHTAYNLTPHARSGVSEHGPR